MLDGTKPGNMTCIVGERYKEMMAENPKFYGDDPPAMAWSVCYALTLLHDTALMIMPR